MGQLLDVSEFMAYMLENDLVIARRTEVVPDRASRQRKLFEKTTASYSEIASSGVWGEITQKRAYQLAKRFAREGEIIKPGQKSNSPEKIVTSAVERIGRMRRTLCKD